MLAEKKKVGYFAFKRKRRKFEIQVTSNEKKAPPR